MDDPPLPWKVVATGLWIAAALGAAAMWAVVRTHEWLNKPLNPPRATETRPVPFSPRSLP